MLGRTGIDMGAPGRGEDAFGTGYAGRVRRDKSGAVSILVGALPQVDELLAGEVAGAALDGARDGDAGPRLAFAGVGEGRPAAWGAPGTGVGGRRGSAG